MITVNNKEYNFDGCCFLDVDGVLNGENWYKSPEYKQAKEFFKVKHKDVNWRTEEREEIWAERMSAEISPAHVNILNKILIKFNLAIVISSTWRGSDFTRNALFLAGIDKYKERLLGYTPILKYLGDDASRDSRGLEIVDWMQKNNYTGKFICLDDDSDFDCKYLGINLLTKHLKTNCHGTDSGLQEKHIVEAEKILCSFKC